VYDTTRVLAILSLMELAMHQSLNNNNRIANNRHIRWLDSPVLALAFFRISRQIIFLCKFLKPTPSPSSPGGSIFFCRSFLPKLTGPHFEAAGTGSPPLHDSRMHVAQGPWSGHTWIRFGRNTRHVLCYISTHVSARCVSTGPHITHLVPIDNSVYVQHYS
jgi:hypothetical protein